MASVASIRLVVATFVVSHVDGLVRIGWRALIAHGVQNHGSSETEFFDRIINISRSVGRQ